MNQASRPGAGHGENQEEGRGQGAEGSLAADPQGPLHKSSPLHRQRMQKSIVSQAKPLLPSSPCKGTKSLSCGL